VRKGQADGPHAAVDEGIVVIALIDYKAGNLTSVRKALAAIQAGVFTPETPDDLAKASGIIVPGVGHFAATRALDERWVDAIVASLGEGRPLLGICLGMQWLFEGSEEAPDLPGLGLLGGRCYRLSAAPAQERFKIPHVGWNNIAFCGEGSIVEGVPDQSQVYFTHSYVAPITGDTVAATEHGEPFASVVQRGQVAGVQFHPEKSGEVGLRILRNFTALAGGPH
jgi:glutamine amidotransferase